MTREHSLRGQSGAPSFEACDEYAETSNGEVGPNCAGGDKRGKEECENVLAEYDGRDQCRERSRRAPDDPPVEKVEVNEIVKSEDLAWLRLQQLSKGKFSRRDELQVRKVTNRLRGYQNFAEGFG